MTAGGTRTASRLIHKKIVYIMVPVKTMFRILMLFLLMFNCVNLSSVVNCPLAGDRASGLVVFACNLTVLLSKFKNSLFIDTLLYANKHLPPKSISRSASQAQVIVICRILYRHSMLLELVQYTHNIFNFQPTN